MDIHFSTRAIHQGQLGLITLDRQKALNALTDPMLQALRRQLDAWAIDAEITCVIIQSSQPDVFCAGGDIRYLYEQGQCNIAALEAYFDNEYTINQLIHHFPKPYVSLVDGLTMGGGVGVSLHGTIRIGTEFTEIAMPETGIGFFPDIGGSYLYAQAPGAVGVYLALTGARLNLANAFYLGLLDYYIPRAKLTQLLGRLETQPLISAIRTLAASPPRQTLLDDLNLINQCFSQRNLDDVITQLNEHAPGWARALKQKSPTSLQITFEQMRRAANLSFDQIIEQDKILARHFIRGQDLYEGIRALIIDKDKTPHWQAPLSPDTIQAYFEPTLGDVHD